MTVPLWLFVVWACIDTLGLLFVIYRLATKGKAMALDLTKLQAQVTADTDATNAAITVIHAIAAQLKASSGDQAAIDALVAQLQANAGSLAAAVTENTPASPAASAPATQPQP